MGAKSDGRFQTRHLMVIPIDTNDANTVPLITVKFATQCLVTEVSAAVRIPGVTHATHALTVLKATTSIGKTTIGTQTAGAVIAASLTDTTFAAADTMVIKTTDSDGTFKGNLIVDYMELFSAT
jgi:hypothetical protein